MCWWILLRPILKRHVLGSIAGLMEHDLGLQYERVLPWTVSDAGHMAMRHPLKAVLLGLCRVGLSVCWSCGVLGCASWSGGGGGGGVRGQKKLCT